MRNLGPTTTTMKFRAKRYTDYEQRASALVDVSAIGRGDTTSFSLCLVQFRRVFGFTPRKGVTYHLTSDKVEIEALS